MRTNQAARQSATNNKRHARSHWQASDLPRCRAELGPYSLPQSLTLLRASLLSVALLGACSSSKKPKSEFLCDVQYTNHLPDVPFEPKLLRIHLPPQRLIRYAASTLEASLRIPLLAADKFLGIPLDLLHPEQYIRPAGLGFGEVDEADEKILPAIREALAAGTRAQPTQLQLFQQGSSNWLRKQEFQSNNLYEVGIRSFGAAEAIDKEYLRIEELKKETSKANSKEKQVELILSTFESESATHTKPTREAQLLD